MSVPEVLPGLTSRFLVRFEDENDLLVGRKQHASARRLLEETKEPESPVRLVSPGSSNAYQHKINHHRRDVGISFHQQKETEEDDSYPRWSPRFDAIPSFHDSLRSMRSLPSLTLPSPRPSTESKRLYASFSSSPIPEATMWQFDNDKHKSPFSPSSPSSNDAVFVERQNQTAEVAADEVWNSHRTHRRNTFSDGNISRLAAMPTLPSAPSLLDAVTANHKHGLGAPQPLNAEDGIPSFIFVRITASRSYHHLDYIDDDEVSLLADNPDEDDAGILPHATYDVLVNILDEIDRDDEEKENQKGEPSIRE